LDYFLARYYSPIQGRFTSPDEFSGGACRGVGTWKRPPRKTSCALCRYHQPSQSLNKYQYSFNNPVRYVDPDGHGPQEQSQQSAGVIQQIIDNTTKIIGTLLRNFERARDTMPEEEQRRGPLSIGDKEMQKYVDAKGQALQQATDVLMVADYTGVAGTFRGVQTGNKQEIATGMVSMAFRFRGAGLALSHFQKHGAEFGFKNALQYVQAAAAFVGSKGGDIVKYVNSAGKVLVYNKATNQFATHTGRIIHTYFKPKKGLAYVKDVIKRDGYKLIQ